MAIYIKGVEKPINCYCCPLSYSENGGLFCYITDAFVGNNPKQDDCPLVYIPEPHGRLIDADKLADDLEIDGRMFNQVYKLNCASWLRSKSTPTVIEGSEQDDSN